MQTCIKIQHDLLATYRDDFHKYGGEINARLLHRILLSNKGGLAEQFVGQQLRAVQTPAMDPQLFYWQRA